jgi:hypothetical protein
MIRPFLSGCVSIEVLPVSEQCLCYWCQLCSDGVKFCVLAYISTRKDHKFALLASHSSKVLVPNLDALESGHCLKDRLSFQSISDSSLELSWCRRYGSWNLLFECEITGEILISFFGPSKLLKVLLLVKRKNLHNSSSFSHNIVSANHVEEITSFVVNYKLRVDVWTVPITTKNAVFWDVTLYDSCKNRRFVGTYHLHHPGEKNRRACFSC